jgi:hypothetical protein
MEWLEGVVLIGGLTSLMLLWVASVVGMLHIGWGIVGKQVLNILGWFKRS